MNKKKFFLLALITVGLVSILFLGTKIVQKNVGTDTQISTKNNVDIEEVENAVKNLNNSIFLENIGQAPDDIKFYQKNKNGGIYFLQDKVVIQNVEEYEGVLKEVVYHMWFPFLEEGGYELVAEERGGMTVSEFRGKDHFSDIPTYEKIVYRNKAGVEVEFLFNKNTVKYNIIVPALFPVEKFSVQFNGIDNLMVVEEGKVVVMIGDQKFTHDAPYSYQVKDGKIIEVPAEYVVKNNQELVFSVASYDQNFPLIIDPILSNLTASTFLGGTDEENGGNVAIDSNGNIFVAGYTASVDFPMSGTPYSNTHTGVNDVVVSKLSSNLQQLLASTYIGGSDSDQVSSIAIDSSGSVYLSGQSASTDFPTTTAALLYDPLSSNGYIVKFNNNLSSLTASRVVGDVYGKVLVNDAGTSVYVVGTSGGNAPTSTPSFDDTHNGSSDIFVLKLSSDLQTHDAGTFIGTGDSETFVDAEITASDTVVFLGHIGSGFQTSLGAYSSVPKGSSVPAGYIGILSSNLQNLVSGTYLWSDAKSLAFDRINQRIYVATSKNGEFASTTPGAYDTTSHAEYAVALSAFSSDLTSLQYSTYIGQEGNTFLLNPKVTVDDSGSVYFFTETYANAFPTTTDSYDKNFSDAAFTADMYIAKMNSELNVLLGSSYLGGTGHEIVADVIVNPSNQVLLVSKTPAADFPMTGSPYDSSHNGIVDYSLALFDNNNVPTLTTSTPSQTSANFVTVTTTISDTDGDITEFSIEYSTDGVTWASSTIGSVEASTGAPNTAAGRVYNIATDIAPSNTVTVTTTWNIGVDIPDTATSTIYLRFTPNDGTENGTTATTSAFAIDTKDPTAPGALTISTLTSSTVAFTFPNTTSTDENFTEYKIHYSTSTPLTTSTNAFTSSTDANLASSTFGGQPTSETFTGLTPNTVYYFNIFAYDSWGYFNSSTEFSTTTKAALPLNLTAASTASSSITFTVGANGNPTSTEYYVATLDNAKNSGWTASTTLSISDLTCETEYTFRAKARNSATVETDWTATIAVTTGACPGTPAVTLSSAALSLSEGGSSGSYTVVLNTAPTDSVTIALGVSSGSQVTLSTASLTFTTLNWSTAQTVTVTPVDDTTVEGAHSVTISHTATSNDADYHGITIGSVTVTLSDNDSSGGGAPPGGNNPPPPPPIDPVDGEDPPVCDETIEQCEEDEDFLPRNRLIRLLQVGKPTSLPTMTMVNSRDVVLLLDTSYANTVALFESLEPSSDFSSVSYQTNDQEQIPWQLTDVQGKHCINGKFRNTGPKIYEYATYLCVTLDTIPPEPPTIGAVHSGIVNKIKKSPPVISGKTEPYATVVIKKEKRIMSAALVSVSTLRVAVATTYYTTANNKGNWSFTFPTYFDTGDYALTVAAQDKAGNVSSGSVATLTITEAAEAPIDQPETPQDEEPLDSVEPEPTPIDLPIDTPTDTPENPSNNPVGGYPDSTPIDTPVTGSSGSGSSGLPLNTTGEDEGGLPSTDIFTPIESQEEGSENLDERTGESIGSISGWRSIEERYRAAALALKPLTDRIKRFTDNPEVERVNQRIAAPVAAVAAVANVATGFGTSLLLILRHLFTQPIMLFRLKRRKKWGVVYNGFTKQPLDLAVVRLLDAKTGTIKESRVTDMKGRYLFIVDPGEYRIEVTKQGFQGISEHLKYVQDDGVYTHVYHGDTISVQGKNDVVGVNIPLTPIDQVRPVTDVLREHGRRIGHTAASKIGIALAVLSFVISPTPLMVTLLALHVGLFFGFRWYVYRPLPDSFGVVRDVVSRKPLAQTVVRIFDAAYNKLVDTKITDSKGRYAALVGPSTYYVTYEKPAYEKKQTEPMDFTVEAKLRGGAIIARNEQLQQEEQKR